MSGSACFQTSRKRVFSAGAVALVFALVSLGKMEVHQGIVWIQSQNTLIFGYGVVKLPK